LFGAGLRSRPAYDGSGSQRIDLIPVVRFVDQIWFIRSTQGLLEGGARTEFAPNLYQGIQLAYEPGRKTSESDFLEDHAVSNVEPGVSIGAHLEWDHKLGPVPITLLGRVRQNVESGRGAQIDGRFNAGVYSYKRFAAALFTQVTWGDANATGSIYDITRQQSATADLPTFNAGSGLLYKSLGLLWSLDISRHWVAVGSLESRRLDGDASRSPLAEDTSNYYASAGLAYHF
jgi:outer membrane scaffolding protein for murein synthesis (MipA/OmpV family)